MDVGNLVTRKLKRVMAKISGTGAKTTGRSSSSVSMPRVDVADEDTVYTDVTPDRRNYAATDLEHAGAPGAGVAHEETLEHGSEHTEADHPATADLLPFTKDASDPRACVSISLALEKDGKLQDAEAAFHEATERFPNDLGLRIEFAWLMHRRRDWDAASDTWAVVREMEPQHIAGYIGQSILLSETMRLDEADAFLEEAIRSLPGEKGLLIVYVGIAELRQDWTEAVTRWGAIRERFPDDPIGWLRGAQALARAGRGDEPVTLLAELANRFPDDTKAWAEAIQMLWQNDRIDAAEQMASEGGTRFGADAVIKALWAEAAVRTRNWQTALGRIKIVEQRIGPLPALMALEAGCRQEMGPS